MKRAVLMTGLHEWDIRPLATFSEFKRLSIIDASAFLQDESSLVEVACPACDSPDREGVFRNNGFLYNECRDCGSLFVSPRPSKEALALYYRDSKAYKYRVEQFERRTADARRTHMIRSHMSWLGRIVDETGNLESRHFADLNSTSLSVFEEARELGLFDVMHSINPLPSVGRECASYGVEVVSTEVSGLAAVTSFGQLENRFSPIDFISWVRGMLADNGIFTFTTRTASGFDIQTLWDKTPYLFVPEHMNIMTVEGLQSLIGRTGFELVELSTPGQLDVELVVHAAESDPSIRLPSFFKYFIRKRGEETSLDFQEFLQKHRLSSHVRLAAARRKDSC